VKFLVDAQLPRRLALWLQQRGHDVIHTVDVAKHDFIGLSRNQVIVHR
jgi:predicted nuclease of predicted toxin-antitoxin system